MKKRFLVLFVLFLALSVITSCKKKEDSTQTGPVVTVAEEKDYERRTFDKDIPTLTVNDDPIVERDTTREENIEEEKVEANESRKLSFVYRGGSTLFRATFSSDKGEIKTNISERYIPSHSLQTPYIYGIHRQPVMMISLLFGTK